MSKEMIIKDIASKSGPEHRLGRAAAPRWGRRGLGERNAGEGALGDRVERGVIGWEVGAE